MKWNISDTGYYLNQICIDAHEENGSLTPIAAVYGRKDAPETIAIARLIAGSPTLYDFVKKAANAGNKEAKETLGLLGLMEIKVIKKAQGVNHENI